MFRCNYSNLGSVIPLEELQQGITGNLSADVEAQPTHPEKDTMVTWLDPSVRGYAQPQGIGIRYDPQASATTYGGSEVVFPNPDILRQHPHKVD